VVAFCVLAVSRLSGGEPLRMQLFPAVAREPAVLTIRVTVEAADENRVLQVVAESSTFYRSSEVQIDGKRAAALNVFEFRNVPTGLYNVTSVLIGPHGQRASASRVARIEPAVRARP
jgi:hypothetical protein